MSIEFRRLLELITERQHNRILRLSFPNDDGPQCEFLCNALEAHEYLSRDFDYTVEVLSDNSSLALKDLQGRLVQVELVQAGGTLRYFSGYVFEFRLKKAGAIAFYEVKLGPWMKYLSLRQDSYIFHNANLQQQATSIFNDYGALARWNVRMAGDDLAMVDAFQYQETDSNYLHRRWEAAGLYYFYDHDEQGHTLNLCDDSTSADPLDGDAVIRYHQHGGAQEEDSISTWTPVRTIVPASVMLGAFDFKAPLPKQVGTPTQNVQGDVQEVEWYEYAGAYGFKDRSDGDRLARLRMEEFEAAGKHFEAVSNNRRVQPGRWFSFIDHTGMAATGAHNDEERNKFLIVEAHHSATNNYLQDSAKRPEYSNRFNCLRKAIPWRPGRGYFSVDTRILAPQTAIVVGPSEQGSIHTDEYGRIRLQFHWDRVGNGAVASSAWVRVSSAWAGAQLGAPAIPRVNSEVIVSWLEGCPDRPIVTGCVHNEQFMPAWDLPTQQALTGMRSRELTPEGGNAERGRSNHLVLDDTSGSIQVQLKSDHEHSQLSLGHITRIEDNAGRKDARGEGFALETGGNGALRAARGLLLSTDGRANAVGGILSRDELIGCLEQALTLAKSLGQGASDRHGGRRDVKPQQALSEAVDALGHGVGNEAGAHGQAAAGQPVIAISAAAGIASVTPKDHTSFAGLNIDTVAGRNQQHYAGQSILSTANKDIEHCALEGDMRHIAAKGKVSVQAQENAIEIIAEQVLNLISNKNSINLTASKEIILQAGGSYIKLGANGIEQGTGGKWQSKASQHVTSGPARLPDSERVWPGHIETNFSSKLVIDRQLHDLLAASGTGKVPYKFIDSEGTLVARGELNEFGVTQRIFHKDLEDLTVMFGEKGPWEMEEEHHDEGCGCGGHHGDDEDDHEPIHGAREEENPTPYLDMQHHPDNDDDDEPLHNDEFVPKGFTVPMPDHGLDDFAAHMLNELVFNDPDIARLIADAEE
jgi:type VI secretion system secreted protein VgrG